MNSPVVVVAEAIVPGVVDREDVVVPVVVDVVSSRVGAVVDKMSSGVSVVDGWLTDVVSIVCIHSGCSVEIEPITWLPPSVIWSSNAVGTEEALFNAINGVPVELEALRAVTLVLGISGLRLKPRSNPKPKPAF